MSYPNKLGVIHAEISLLEFVKPRALDISKTQHLATIFQKNCDRDAPQHRIRAHISLRELHVLLETSQVTREDLHKSLIGGEYQRIYTSSHKLRCLRGRHRTKAAQLALSETDQWWTVELYQVEPENKEELERREIEQYSHQHSYTDGEIYQKVRFYEKQGRYDLVDEWTLRLSEDKRALLSQLLQRNIIVEGLDSLLDYPGLWKALKLGYVKRMLTARSDELFRNYFHHTAKILNDITLQNPAIRPAVCIQTMEGIQQRVPALNESDRQHIIRGMDQKTLFPSIVDETLRTAIKQSILAVRVIIPSFETFHQNFLFLEIGARIIRNQLIIGSLKTSLYEAVNVGYSRPENIMVEVQEGEFRPCSLPQGETVKDFMYKQLFLSTLRQFPSFGEDKPRKEAKQGPIPRMTDPIYSSLLLARAHILGYRCGNVQSIQQEVSAYRSQAVYDSNSNQEALKRRMGRPFFNSYMEFRTQLFLPNLIQLEDRESLSVMFVMRDFIKAFFGPIHQVRIRFDVPPIRIWSAGGASMDHPSEVPSTNQEILPTCPDDEMITRQSGDQFSCDDTVMENNVPEPENVNSNVEEVQRDFSSAASVSPDASGTSIGDYTLSLTSTDSRTEFWQTNRSFLLPNYLESSASPVNSEASTYSGTDRFMLSDVNTRDRRSFLSLHPSLSNQSTIVSTSPSALEQRHRSYLGASPFNENAQRQSVLSSPVVSACSLSSRRHRSYIDISPLSAENTRRHVLSSPVVSACSLSSPHCHRSYLGISPNTPRQSVETASHDISPANIKNTLRRQPVLSNPVSSPPVSLSAEYESPERTLRGRRSFIDVSQHWQAQSFSDEQQHRDLRAPVQFNFHEHNGMRELLVSKSQYEMEYYLEARRGWVWIVVNGQISQTIRADHILKHMINSTNSKYMVIKASSATRIRLIISQVPQQAYPQNKTAR